MLEINFIPYNEPESGVNYELRSGNGCQACCFDINKNCQNVRYKLELSGVGNCMYRPSAYYAIVDITNKEQYQ